MLGGARGAILAGSHRVCCDDSEQLAPKEARLEGAPLLLEVPRAVARDPRAHAVRRQQLVRPLQEELRELARAHEGDGPD
eukprot:1135458-Prymnesium_polylepis.1